MSSQSQKTMMTLLSWAVLTTLVLTSQADPNLDCDNYLNSTTYQQAVGRWTIVYSWPVTTETKPTTITFGNPTRDEISKHRNPPLSAGVLTEHPKLLYTVNPYLKSYTYLFDVADKITIVDGYYNKSHDKEAKIRKIGDFLVVDYVDVKEGEINRAAMLYRHELNEQARQAAEAVASCVKVKNLVGGFVQYSG